MIKHKKVTFIKDDYNPYSKSQYSTSYFTGGNTDWQYLQQVGGAKRIDISKQVGADQVEHSNCLSETLGLYYIAKAVRDNKITEKIADNLAIYFISQSSLKEQKISNDLINKIINLIIKNKDVYNFMYNVPMIDGQTNLYKNYSIDLLHNLKKFKTNHWNY